MTAKAHDGDAIRRANPARARLLDLYRRAVDAAHPAICLPPHLPDPPAGGRILIVGAGKADAAMAVAAEAHYRQRNLLDRVSGFVTTRHGFKLPTQHIEILEAGHPVPDDGSVSGASRTLAAVTAAGPDDLIVVLLSGGASALWTAPVAGVTLEAKQALTRALLRSGATIAEINTVRRHLSRIKGGRLTAATRARVLTLAISDVPGDEPQSIGSGPTVADPTTLEDARALLTRFFITPSSEIATALADPANETLKPNAAALARSSYVLIATPQQSLSVAADAARALGYRPILLGDALEGEAREVGVTHAELARNARQRGERVAILSGGELTVTVRGQGSGGPNQEYALALAIALDGTAGISALAADTDGIDGGGGRADDPAGAMVFPDTLTRAKARHVDAQMLLEGNDSSRFFRAVGDLVEVGPTQTNVNDFRAILVDP
jgi:hydroxypyruvate reductase